MLRTLCGYARSLLYGYARSLLGDVSDRQRDAAGGLAPWCRGDVLIRLREQSEQ
jgi:hypothetical protein